MRMNAINARIAYLISVALMFFGSCAKDSIQKESTGKMMTITACAAETGSRTVLQEDGTTLWWTPGDAINFFYGGEAKGKFTTKITEPSAFASFSGTLDVVTGTIEMGHSAKDFWGVYPYSSERSCDDQSVTISVPAHQRPVAGEFPTTLFPSIAKSTSLNLAFYNVCGGLKFSVSHKDVKSVTFKAIGGQIIAGDVKAGFDEKEKPFIMDVVSGASEVSVIPSEGDFFEPEQEYYVVLLPGVLSDGFSVTYLRDITVGTFTMTSTVEIKRSKFGVLTGADANVVFVPSDEIIIFADDVAKEACVAAFDDNNDGEVSYAEAAAAMSMEELFYDYPGVQRFMELKYFTGVTSLIKTFKGCSALTEVAIPDHISVIGNQAFYGCAALASVTLSNQTIEIGNQAFYNCSVLQSVSIPENVTSLGNQVFYGTSLLTSITLPENITTIGSRCFGTTLKSVRMLGMNPPAIQANSFGTMTVIYVPEEAEEVYKNAEGWSAHADYINPKAINLSSEGTANCYVVAAPGSYMFNASVKGNSAESVGEPVSADVLWESFGTATAPNVGDIIASVQYSDGYINFTTPETLQNGNAVIAIRDAEGTILWSWHIWVCKGFSPDEKAHIYNNDAGVVMDRDLGARSAGLGSNDALGLYYQWGRKDPFLNNVSISANTAASSSIVWPSPVSINEEIVAYSIQHPTTFIRSNYSVNTALWDRDKTKYDPCPPGWRVPFGGKEGMWAMAFKSYNSEAEFRATEFWSSNMRGMLIPGSITGESAWFPSCGYFDSNSGKREYAGYYSYRWTVTSNGSKYYTFSILWHPSYYQTPIIRTYSESHPPATGNLVRCCKEL